MVTIISIFLIIALAIILELAYEKVTGSGGVYKSGDTMEEMSNSGFKTSLRIIAFGLLSIFVVLALINRFV